MYTCSAGKPMAVDINGTRAVKQMFDRESALEQMFWQIRSEMFWQKSWLRFWPTCWPMFWPMLWQMFVKVSASGQLLLILSSFRITVEDTSFGWWSER
jgi:hypothetical protein